MKQNVDLQEEKKKSVEEKTKGWRRLGEVEEKGGSGLLFRGGRMRRRA